MISPDKIVLVITSSIDATSTLVCDRLFESGIRYVRLNAEEFPTKWRIDWSINPRIPPLLINSTTVVDFLNVHSVLYRRAGVPNISSRVIEESAKAFAQSECEKILTALWQDISSIPWVNHPIALRLANHKPEQLKRAKNLGFNIPDTILTSNKEYATQFWCTHEEGVVFKSLHQDSIELNGRVYLPYVNKLTQERLVELERLELMPVLFQEYIKPALEIRVTVVDNLVFAAEIDQTASSDKPDWRRLPPDSQAWKPHILPEKISNMCVEITHQYGLNFGALDLIVDRSGRYYFLEINPNGQWAWIESITGLPICNALVDFLSY
jgi:hypothetical protein